MKFGQNIKYQVVNCQNLFCPTYRNEWLATLNILLLRNVEEYLTSQCFQLCGIWTVI